MGVLISKVSGVTFDNRQSIIERCKINMPCRIVPEPDNPHDSNALAVHVATAPGVVEHVGYIPRELAAKVAPYLEGEALMVKINDITGGFIKPNGDRASLGLEIRIELPERKGTA